MGRPTRTTKNGPGGQRHSDTCSITGCEKPYRAKGFCGSHYNKAFGYRKPPKGGRVKKEFVGYRAAHIRVEEARGKAKSHQCVDCDERAHDWSLDAECPNPLYDERGMPYSLDVTMYSPRCIPCHRIHDGGYSQVFLYGSRM